MNAELKYSFFLFLRLCVYRPRDTLAKAFFIERRLVSRQTGTVGCLDVVTHCRNFEGVERNCGLMPYLHTMQITKTGLVLKPLPSIYCLGGD